LFVNSQKLSGFSVALIVCIFKTFLFGFFRSSLWRWLLYQKSGSWSWNW